MRATIIADGACSINYPLRSVEIQPFNPEKNCAEEFRIPQNGNGKAFTTPSFSCSALSVGALRQVPRRVVTSTRRLIAIDIFHCGPIPPSTRDLLKPDFLHGVEGFLPLDTTKHRLSFCHPCDVVDLVEQGLLHVLRAGHIDCAVFLAPPVTYGTLSYLFQLRKSSAPNSTTLEIMPVTTECAICKTSSIILCLDPV